MIARTLGVNSATRNMNDTNDQIPEMGNNNRITNLFNSLIDRILTYGAGYVDDFTTKSLVICLIVSSTTMISFLVPPITLGLRLVTWITVIGLATDIVTVTEIRSALR